MLSHVILVDVADLGHTVAAVIICRKRQRSSSTRSIAELADARDTLDRSVCIHEAEEEHARAKMGRVRVVETLRANDELGHSVAVVVGHHKYTRAKATKCVWGLDYWPAVDAGC